MESNKRKNSEIVQALTVSDTNLFAGTGGGVFLSTNNGLTYSSVIALAVSGTNLFVGTWDGGVFSSTNNGASWNQDGLKNTHVWSIGISGMNLFAGIDGGGVWRRPLSEMITATSVEGRSIDVPAHFSLAQNYPIPFNPSTTIRFGLPQKADMSLVVFNTLGQQVATLVDGSQDAGSHEVHFDGSELSSGVYFYRIQAGASVEAKNLFLVR